MQKILKKFLKSGLKKIIHINQAVIKRNRKKNECEPVITTKTYKSNDYGHEVHIDGPCKIIYRPERPLSCGAHVWLETSSAVEVIQFEDQQGSLKKGEDKDVANSASRKRQPHNC